MAPIGNPKSNIAVSKAQASLFWNPDSAIFKSIFGLCIECPRLRALYRIYFKSLLRVVSRCRQFLSTFTCKSKSIL